MSGARRRRGHGTIEALKGGGFRARMSIDGTVRTIGNAETEDEANALLVAAREKIAAGQSFEDLMQAGEARFKSYVYFIQDGNDGPIKIGIAASPAKRLYALQTGHHRRLRLLAAMPGGPRLEVTLHAAFAGTRKIGEWFEPTPAVIALVAEVAAAWGA